MAWIEFHQQLGRHPKVLRLAGKLHIHPAQVIGHLAYLWWWSLDYVPNGDLSASTSTEIASAATWPGDADKFLAALKETEWIDENGMIHDWMDYAGKLVEQRSNERERTRMRVAEYRKRNTNVTALHGRSNGGTQPNPTIPNQTNKPMRKDGAQQNPKDGFGSSSGLEEEAFLRFWKFYPKKRSKGDAEKAWKSIKPGSELVEKILDAITRAKTSRDWLKENGKFVPYPATWLRSRGWEDEFDGVAPPAPGADVRRKILEVQGLIPVGGEV